MSSRDISYRKINVGKLLGYFLYGAAAVLFYEEYASFEAAGVIRSPEYVVGTFVICGVSLVLSSVLLQLSKEVAGQALGFGLCFVLMVLIEQSFSIFLFTELAFFCGFLILLNSKFRPGIGLAFSCLLIVMYLFPSVLAVSLGKNDLLKLDAAIPDFLIRLGGAVFLAVAAAGSSLVQTVFQQKSAAEASVNHLNMTIAHLSKINQDLQSYARTIDEEAIASERNRISREIHDISGYRFTNIIALMDAAMSMGGRNPEKLQELYIAARSQAKDGILETRRALQALRTDELYRRRGIAAIYKICSVFHEVTGIKIAIESGNTPNSLGPRIDSVIYRLVQEALTNAMLHGRASEVKIYLWIHDQILNVVVQDNGIGALQVEKGIGLSGMEERVGELGGVLETGPVPEGGFKVRAQILLSEAGLNEAGISEAGVK